MLKSFLPAFLILIICSCLEPSLPKQHAYPQIDFPEHNYQLWKIEGTPYSFEKPAYSVMQLDTSEAYWYNLTYIPFNATLHLSYRTFKSQFELDTLIHDTRNLVFKHTIKASDILETEVVDSNGRSGMYYEIEGETATPYNFYLTDSKSKFFRGALYFNDYTTIDSVGPVVDFIKRDIGQMIRSFKFE
ncbi:MAG: gliding motility lipoprotein GldD [Bacteroidia bacterium]